jgi:hypothetical protein
MLSFSFPVRAVFMAMLFIKIRTNLTSSEG